MSRDKTKSQPGTQTAPAKTLVPQLLTLETVKLQLLQAELKDQQQQQMATADHVGEQLRVTAARLYWLDRLDQPDARQKEEEALNAQLVTLKTQSEEVGQQLKETQKQRDAATKQLRATLQRLKEELEQQADSDSDSEPGPNQDSLLSMAYGLDLNPGADSDPDSDSDSDPDSDPDPDSDSDSAPASEQVASKPERVPEPEPEPEPEPVPEQEPLLLQEPTAGSNLPPVLFTGAAALATTVYYYMHQDEIYGLLMGCDSASPSGW